MKLKEQLYYLCKSYVNDRLETIEDILSSNQKALQSETKSSAGDKHETGRAMLQLEMEKAGQQLVGVSQMNTILAKIDFLNTSKKAHFRECYSYRHRQLFFSNFRRKVNCSWG